MFRALILYCFVLVSLAQTPDFVRDVRPILMRKCSACHGAAQQMNGLRVDDGAALLKGGYSGPSLVSGKPAESKLVERITSSKEGVRMPPAGPAMTAAEVELVKAWIAGGAVVPATAGGGTTKPRPWAFQAVRKQAPPAVKTANWVRNPIDAFVLARLEAEGLSPSPEADRATLLRRLSLDLTGLPPSTGEIDDFLADASPDAYERQVDRLLASPHYGEKMARPWLDLAHYADSDGFEKDQVRPWAWRYRNWVIGALNSGMGYDRFTIEQLAGDLLPNATVEQRVATGFLRNTLTNREAGVDREEARFEQLINRVNTLGTVWLGLTVTCSQCHDHKYDPLTQRDYYSLFAFFDRTEEQDIDAPLAGERGPYLAAIAAYRAKRQALLAEYEVPALQPAWEERMREAIQDPGKTPEWDFALTSMKALVDRAVKILMTKPEDRAERDARKITDYFIQRNFTAIGMDKAKMERLKELRKKMEELEAAQPTYSQAMAMTDDPAAPPTSIRIRGDWKRKGVEVTPGVPGALPPLAGGGRATRLDLARWLVSREHPLTARVAVNRAWQEFFGRGIVKTAEDFGNTGEKPSHPELLDWLAADFMENGWLPKRLHKQIVMSAAYRQASGARTSDARDPENKLLARQSRLRLAAENVRDAALQVSGLLNNEIGGRSVRPPQPAGVAELGYAGSVKWNASTGKDRYRRGLYIHFQRTTPYPMLMSFDAPEGSVACARRARSNTSLQALNLLNDEVFFEAANALAYRIETEGGKELSERLEYGFRLALGRKPTGTERARLARFHDEQARIFATEAKDGRGQSAWLGVSRVLLNLDEFITRE